MSRPVAVVTGAGSGIGRAVALRPARATATRSRSPGGGARAAGGDDRAGGAADRALAVPTDVDRPGLGRRPLRRAPRALRPRSTCCSTTPGRSARPRPARGSAVEDWQRVVDINLTGAFLCTQAAFRLMKAQDPRGGRIINNGSISAHVPRPHSAAYTATKHAITGLTKSTRARRPRVRHRLRPDRHRQRGDRDDRSDGARASCRPTARSRPSRRWTSAHVARRRRSTWRACRSTPTSCS